MKRIYAATLALPLALAGCQGLPASTTTNAIACMSTLLVSGSFDPAALALLATVTPSCQALAADVIRDIINQVAPQNAQAARAQGRLK